MFLKKLFWKIYLPFLLITLLSLTAVAWFASSSFKDYHIDHTAAGLEARARILAVLIVDEIAAGQYGKLRARSRLLGRQTGTRFTVVLSTGRVVADSSKEPGRMDNHGDRPEIYRALKGKRGVSTRYSYTLKKEMMYVALPLRSKGRVAAVVRASMPLAAVSEVLSRNYLKILLGGLVAALLAALVSLLISHWINRPIAAIKIGAEKFALGDLDYKLPPSTTMEVSALSGAMNHMADQMNARIRTITRQRNELEAVLGSMVEAVVAIDMEERILRYNKAAWTLLGLPEQELKGRTVQEVARNPDLQRFIGTLLESGSPLSEELVLHDQGKRFIQAQGAPLRDFRGKSLGALIVLHDVTRLKRLETIRKDFVANVSHELRTPIASIKGAVETLENGTMESGADRAEFLGIIARHTDRLNAIIEDLLSLSRLELEGEEGRIARKSGTLGQVLERALLASREQAAAHDITLELDCASDLTALMNPPLLEEAVVNLLDNAIKYSEPGSRVMVEGRQSEGAVLILVRDQGSGIPREQLPRIFERFYRVDKARSRKMGGTGLGLAIVKHIASVHQGRVTVESEPGKGSTFTLHLPLR